MPAKAGIQNYLKILDFRLRGNDAKGRFKTFYETINIGRSMFDVQSVHFSTAQSIWKLFCTMDAICRSKKKCSISQSLPS